jgi:transposase-like protein
MQPISYARHQFPPDIIRHTVWLYLRFTLSYRDVEELLVERGLDVSYETVRRWVLKFGPAFASCDPVQALSGIWRKWPW